MSQHLLLLAGVSLSIGTNPGGFPNSLGKSPFRGARSWNSVRQEINQTFAQASLDGLLAPLSNGISLAASGYRDFGLDDGWAACGAGVNGSYHDATGYPIVNASRFPSMLAFTTYARERNLTASWYMNCCGCKQGEHQLSQPHYEQDAAATVSLGFSGLKVDGCGNEPNISAWASALFATGSQIILENCNDDDPFRPTTNSITHAINCPYNHFRTSIDGSPSFRSTLWNLEQTFKYLNVSNPGCFAYPDMLTLGTPAVGYGGDSFLNNCNGTRMSETEARAQFVAFALISSPLILGFDVANSTERALWAPIVTHAPTLERNAAWDGEAGRLVSRSQQNWTGNVPVGGVCELVQQNTLPLWVVIGKRLAHDPASGLTTRFAAVLLVGDFAGAVDFEAPLEAMGFPPLAHVSSTDGWSGSDTGQLQSAWVGRGVSSPGGLYRIFEAL